jgi:acetyltransferase-like isoleucine patch superfamily enzyme
MLNAIKLFINTNKWLYLIKIKIQRLKDKFRKSIIGKNNVIVNNGVFWNVKYDIIGNNNTVEIMHRTTLSDMTIFIRGNNHKLKIEENCILRGGSFWFEDSFCEIFIGKNTSIESAHFAVTEIKTRIDVGEDCMFSNGIELRTGDSHAIIDIENNVKINNAQNIMIGNHVWIGARSIILKGVVIGDNTIIGTGSIVTKSILNNSVAVGIPANVIKRNVNWVRERFYNKE